MALVSSWFKNDPVFANAANNNPPLVKGAQGESVRILQQALHELGHPMKISMKKYGSPDGIYGKETKDAVEAFQKKNGLASEADGRVGKNTLAKLDQRMAATGKPKPNLPPLNGGPGPVTLDSLSAAVVAILREPAALSVNLMYESVWFGGSLLQKVAQAIEQGKVTVAHKPKLEGWARYVLFNYEQYPNRLELSFNNPRSSPFLRSIVVHEAVHVYHDIVGIPRPKYFDEGLGFAVQALYHSKVVGKAVLPAELIYSAEAPVFNAALIEIEESKAIPMPIVTFHGVGITNELKKNPEYKTLNEYFPYDGV